MTLLPRIKPPVQDLFTGVYSSLKAFLQVLWPMAALNKIGNAVGASPDKMSCRNA